MLVDDFGLSPRDMRRVNEPLRHILLERHGDNVRGAVVLRFDGTVYREDFMATNIGEYWKADKSIYEQAMRSAIRKLRARLPLTHDDYLRWHWSDLAMPRWAYWQ
jgi:hypothetical protein